MQPQDALVILDLVDSGVIMLDENQNIVFWNQFISDTSHIQFNVVENKHWLDVFPALQESRILKAVNKAIDLSFPSILSYKLIKDKFPLYRKSLATNPPYLLAQSIIIKPLIEDGKNKGCIIYINDVSAASKREEELNNQSLELRDVLENYTQAQNQFAEVFESAHNGIIVFDSVGAVINANSAAISLLSLSQDSIVSNNISHLLPEVKKQYFSIDDGCYIYNDDIKTEIEQTLDNVDKKHLSISLSQMEHIENKDNKGNKDDFFVYITDITERKIAEEKLLTANAELEEFAYRTSHDLRSPLVSSINLMEIAKNSLEKNDKPKVKLCLDHTEKSLRKLETLVKDILSLTESQNKEEEIQEVDLELMIQEALENIDQLKSFGGMQCHMQLNHRKPLMAKKTRINMIIENLLSNSVKYRDPENNTPKIIIETSMEDRDFVMNVSDNGLGIPKEQQHKLFKMFNRFHPKVAFGSGLGLYLMKKSAHVLGGDISYQNQEKGACFRLKIPQ